LELRSDQAVRPPISSTTPTAPKTSFELLAMHRPDSLVAFGGAGAKTAGELLSDAARVSRALPPATPNSHVLLVFENDRYAMAAALLGALDRGHAVALPSSSRRDSILAVNARPETVAIVHDTDAGIPIAFGDLTATPSETASAEGSRGLAAGGADGVGGVAGEGGVVDEGEPALTSPILVHPGVIATVFTSGTMGPMTPWPKTSVELLGEAQTLGTTFDVEPEARIVGTVPPGHIYGLLFTILLPLMRGAAFSRDTPHHAEAIAHCVRHNEATILVTVPVQLRALGGQTEGAFPSLRRVFSSTGPLPESVAVAFAARFGLPVTEIFGSTETGGIASRLRQSGGLETWQPLDGVGISKSPAGRLEVDSPFVHADLPRPFETSDLVEIHGNGSFSHLGRSDGVVKIGGRRVSIPEVEECLRQHADVDDAAVVAIPAPGGRGHQLLAAVVPNTCEVDGLVGALRKALRKNFEPSCLPKRMLVVDAIPKDENGKVPRDRLLRLFDLQPSGKPENWLVEWGEPVIGRERDRERLEISARIPEDYAWFEGHYENYPVLAGAVQLKELILPTVKRAFSELGSVLAMNRIKFTGRILPGDRVVVRVERGNNKPGRVQFEIRKTSESCARGVLVLVEAERS